MPEETWQEGFHRRLIDAVVNHGAPVDEKPSIYSWVACDWGHRREYVREVGIDYEATPIPGESRWDEFMGTFYEGDTRVYGVDVHLVCLDGTRVHWRYSGTLGSLIQAVVSAGD